MKRKAFKRIIVFLIFFLLIILMMLAGRYIGETIIVDGIIKDHVPIKFSQEIWENDPYNRDVMIEDLLKSYDFLTMTKDDVINLLGNQRLSVEKDTLIYETGGGYWHDQLLIFIFDKTEKIIHVGLAN